MKKIKVERAVYAAWDYELELAHLNEMSEKGWQLIRGGCFHTKYERDDSVVYRYQLDHNMKIENRLRYIDTFREQGWEYINSTFNGWHYFRKVYDPAMPAEEYEIYSDRPSKQEMAGRLSKLLTVLAVIVGLMFAASAASFIMEPGMAMIGIMVEMLAALILTGTGAVRMCSVGGGKVPARKFPVAALVTVALAGLVWFTVFAGNQPVMYTSCQATDAQMTLEMRLPDWIHISAACENAQSLTVEFSSSQKALVKSYATAMDKPCALESGRHMLFLLPGEYTLSAQCDQETMISLQID